MTEQLDGVDDPRERLIEGMVIATAQWFAKARHWHRGSPPPQPADRRGDGRTVGGDQGTHRSFLISLGPDDPDVVERRARWLVRVMTSLLMFPGHDEADERAMIEEFVVPMVVPTTQDATG